MRRHITLDILLHACILNLYNMLNRPPHEKRDFSAYASSEDSNRPGNRHSIHGRIKVVAILNTSKHLISAVSKFRGLIIRTY